jgi:hypothetical protein
MIAAKTSGMKQKRFSAHILFAQRGLAAIAAFNWGHRSFLTVICLIITEFAVFLPVFRA